MTTYYVDNTHGSTSDSNPGTEALPWETMIHGCAQLDAGDTLLVKNGTYYSETNADWRIPGIRPVNSGTESNRIIIKAYPGHTPVIDGTTVDHPHFGTYGVDYITIDGFKLSYAHLRLDTSSHILIQNCDLVYGWKPDSDPSYTKMIEFRISTDSTIRNCKIHDGETNSPDTGTNRAAVILHWASDIIIENNLFYDNVIAFRNKSGSSGESGLRNIFRYNIVKDSLRGVYVSGYTGASADNRIEQNIFIDVETGVNVDLGNDSLIIVNNVFYLDSAFVEEEDTPAAILYQTDGLSENANHELYNNIIVNYDSAMSINRTNSTPTNLYCDYNSYSGYTGWNGHWSYLTFAQWKTLMGGDANSLDGNDPLFVDVATDDFHLQSGSPCSDTGKTGVNMGAYITGNETIGLESLGSIALILA